MERSQYLIPPYSVLLKVFQSLSGIMERSQGANDGHVTHRDGFNPFQGLWNVLSLVLAAKAKWNYSFNPFQGLWNVLRHCNCLTLPVVAVSIPFRDYGTFSSTKFEGCVFCG